MRSLLIIATIFAVAALASTDYISEFESFKVTYNRKYANAKEEAARLRIFLENMKTAEKLQEANPLATFGVNQFADLSPEEFEVYHNGAAFFAERAKEVHDVEKIEGLPAADEKVDWRDKGAVTPVKDQGQCGSCWAFSATGSIEGQWFVAGHPLTSVSEQQLTSCDTLDHGCSGGLMDRAWQWIVQYNGGQIATEEDYPYVSGTGRVPACNKSTHPYGAILTGYSDLPKDEKGMGQWVSQNGPLSIAVDATTFQSYKGGIVTNCISSRLNHGVLAVGYDETFSTPYWIIKNSWGTRWGESGYIRVKKGSNQCMLNQMPCTAKVGSGPGPTTKPGPTTQPPAGTFMQMQCEDYYCSEGCNNYTFPTYTCLTVSGGGSAICHCTSTKIIETFYPYAEDCTGYSEETSMPLNECLESSGGGSFVNYCNSTNGLRHARRLRHLRH
jgi:cysteine peptidase B